MQWESDHNLRARMLVSLALVAVMPLAFVATMTLAANSIILPLAATLFETQPTQIHVPLLPVFALTLVGMAACYVAGDDVALRSVGATRVNEATEPDLHARLGRLAASAGLPRPDVAIIDSRAPNAFATGRSPETATIAVTRGLLTTLDGDQLDAVLAHELAHVRNRDATVMTIAYLLPTFTYYIATIAYVVLTAIWRGMASVRTHGRDARAVAAVVILFVVTTIVTITVSAVFWAASFLLFRVLSRYREYAADRGSAAITGEPLALATALERINDDLRARPDRDLRDLDGGVEALYVSPLNLPMFEDDDPALLSQDLFPESHPPTSERIRRLQELHATFEQ